MTDLRESTTEPRRYAEPDAVIDEPVLPHLVMAASGIAGILVLMGLFALATGHIVTGWWLALFALPTGLLAISAAAALHTLRASR